MPGRKNAVSNSKSRSSVASAPVSSTPVRNTSLPPRQPTGGSTSIKKSPPTHDQIARRAYDIWKSGRGGSQDENWYRAERELRGS